MEFFSIKQVPCISAGTIHSKDLDNLGALLARQTFGFDFIFSAILNTKKPVCVEFNGWRSGINGLYKLVGFSKNSFDTDTRIVTRSCASLLLEKAFCRFDKQNSYESHFNFYYGALLPLKIQLFRIKQIFVYKWKNKRNIGCDIESVCEEIFNDKLVQKQFIPAPHRIPSVKPDEMSDKTLYMLKYRFASGGSEINLVDKSNISESRLLMNGFDDVIIEPYIEPLPADIKFKRGQYTRACMRLYSTFRFYSEGEVISIVPELALAYQRVAQNINEKIINLSRGAIPVPASRREFDLAWPVAKEVVTKVAQHFWRTSNVLHIENW